MAQPDADRRELSSATPSARDTYISAAARAARTGNAEQLGVLLDGAKLLQALGVSEEGDETAIPLTSQLIRTAYSEALGAGQTAFVGVLLRQYPLAPEDAEFVESEFMALADLDPGFGDISAEILAGGHGGFMGRVRGKMQEIVEQKRVETIAKERGQRITTVQESSDDATIRELIATAVQDGDFSHVSAVLGSIEGRRERIPDLSSLPDLLIHAINVAASQRNISLVDAILAYGQEHGLESAEQLPVILQGIASELPVDKAVAFYAKHQSIFETGGQQVLGWNRLLNREMSKPGEIAGKSRTTGTEMEILLSLPQITNDADLDRYLDHELGKRSPGHIAGVLRMYGKRETDHPYFGECRRPTGRVMYDTCEKAMRMEQYETLGELFGNSYLLTEGVQSPQEGKRSFDDGEKVSIGGLRADGDVEKHVSALVEAGSIEDFDAFIVMYGKRQGIQSQIDADEGKKNEWPALNTGGVIQRAYEDAALRGDEAFIGELMNRYYGYFGRGGLQSLLLLRSHIQLCTKEGPDAADAFISSQQLLPIQRRELSAMCERSRKQWEAAHPPVEEEGQAEEGQG